jgi:hypothetical protein
MRRTKDIRVPRRSGAAGLVAVPMLVKVAAGPSKAGMPDERKAQERASGSANGTVYRLLAYDDADDSVTEAFPADGCDHEDGIQFDLDDLITVEEVAAVLNVRRQWIIRRKLPFVRQMSRKKYVCSRVRLRLWLASRSGPLKAG